MAMMENDRAALKKLGADELRSSDWMLPIRIQIWEKKLSDFYGRTQSMSYVRQAHFFERLFTETHAAGMKYAGYVGADGEPVLLNQGTRSHSIWGLNANELQLSLLWSSHANGTVPLDKPQPFSPLFCSGREPSELLRITSENAHLDWQSDFIKDYLPPLFQKELKP